MGQQQIGLGAAANDGTGDPLRTAGEKINDNFDELYGVTGQTAMIPVLAGGMVGRNTSGAQSDTLETVTNKINIPVLDFDMDNDEFAQFVLPMPESWDGGNCYAEFLWTSEGTGDVIWTIQGTALGDADSLDQAFEALVSVTDSVIGSADHHISARSGAFSLGSYGVPGSTAIIQIGRDADNVSDTLDADARLIGIRLYVTLDDYEDS